MAKDLYNRDVPDMYGRDKVAVKPATKSSTKSTKTVTPPKSKATPHGSYVEEKGGTQSKPAGKKKTSAFGQAFADARKAGEKVFTWNGKRYTTAMASSKKKADNKQASTKTRTPAEEKAAQKDAVESFNRVAAMDSRADYTKSSLKDATSEVTEAHRIVSKRSKDHWDK